MQPHPGIFAATAGLINRAGGHLATVSLWILTAVVFMDVVLRTLGSPSLWASEVSVYLMLAVAFLGAGATQAVDGHFRVTFLRDLFGPSVRRGLDAIAFAISAAFAVLFTIGAWKLASFSWMLDFRSPTILQVPLWLLQGLMVLGGVLLTLATLRDLFIVLLYGSHARDPRSGGEVI
jgi:TRAP-type C4-dicarboxylate transport system permease small subunit